MANEADQYQNAVKELQCLIARANADLDALEMKRRETVAYKNGLVDARDKLEDIFVPRKRLGDSFAETVVSPDGSVRPPEKLVASRQT